jgi:hypothetical protein
VSLKQLLGRILLAGLLQIGALAGMKMTPEDIEKVMNVMHRTKIVKIVKKDDS